MAIKAFNIKKGSIAEEIGIKKGDLIISINESKINDILDYDFYCKEEILLLEIKLANNIKVDYVEVEKDMDEDLGIEFETFLIDAQHTCTNKCIFCFVDQMPEGLRESLYFRDDDERMSFLFGNYITMTNMKQSEVDRIIKMKISPINISVHSTDSKIRRAMLGNKFSDKTLNYLKQLNDAGIKINCQIVLCKGINDGEHLIKTINDLLNLENSVESIAIVPVGVTKYREKLPRLQIFDKASSIEVIDTIHKISDEMLNIRGTRVVYPSDEFFLKAQLDLPEADYYEEYKQLTNGVGMLRLLIEEFTNELSKKTLLNNERQVSIITGEAAYETILFLCNIAMDKFSNLKVDVKKIKNNFFGGNVIVSGLVTGTDIIDQISKDDLYEDVLIPSVMLKYGENKFLDEYTVKDLEKDFSIKIKTVDNNGHELLEKILGEV
ncbi:MAG: DUF512 domain-containing protein [Oscillospiraceae bacterium]